MHRFLLLFTWMVLVPPAAAAPEPAVVRDVPEPPHPAWLDTDPELQQKVTVDFKGRALRVVFDSLHRGTGVDLQPGRDLAEYRVSLHATAQPLGRVMARLLDLFGHGTLPTKSCQWDRLTAKDRPNRYYFNTTMAGREEERAMLDRPLQTVARWLRDLRDYTRLPADKRKQFQTDWSSFRKSVESGRKISDLSDPVGAAVGTLTDEQITRLAQDGRLDVPQFTPSNSGIEMMRSQARSTGATPAARGEEAPSGAFLTLESFDDWNGASVLMLNFRSGYPSRYPSGYGLDTLGITAIEQDDDRDDASGPDIDLLAHSRVEAGKVPIMSLAAALELFARAAQRPVYAEVFLKTRQPLSVSRGKPGQVLAEICRLFHCNWRRVGGDYIVWAKDWAYARAQDVPQPLLDRWLAARQRKGRFELGDLLEMTQLSDEQLHTVERVLSAFGPFAPPNRTAMRLLAKLTPAQRARAYHAAVVYQPHTSAEMAALARQFGRERLAPPIRVRLEQRPNGTAIQFSDGIGAARPAWAYEASEEPTEGHE